MDLRENVLGIIVCGLPAPGINGVIAAVTMAALKRGWCVRGFMDGFTHLMTGYPHSEHVRDLQREDVLRIHLEGGSILRTARVYPTHNRDHLDNVTHALQLNRINYLVTIGGHDTAAAASLLYKLASYPLSVVHVPKTVSNVLPLPPATYTFGFQSARAVGVQLVQQMVTIAQTTNSWYIVDVVGHRAGHLPLAIGKAAGAELTLIPEQFKEAELSLETLCDHVEATIVKSRAQGRGYGVVILAESLVFRLCEEDRALWEFGGESVVEADEINQIVQIGKEVLRRLMKRFRERNLSTNVRYRKLSYELTCAPPNPFDMEYTRDLGYGAVKFLDMGGQEGMITYQGGRMNVIPFEEMIDKETGRPRMRFVDTEDEGFAVAQSYMTRLTRKDIDNQHFFLKLLEAARMSEGHFEDQFSHLLVR